jgi:hypothetical protein
MILLGASIYAKYKALIATLGGPTAQRRILYTSTPPGGFTTLAIVPGAGNGGAGEEAVGVLLVSTDPTIPGSFLTDFPTAILVDSFAMV